MLNLLSSLVDVIKTLVTLVINIFDSLINLFTHIPTYTAFLINSVNVLPTVFIPFIIASISLYVVLLVLGR